MMSAIEKESLQNGSLGLRCGQCHNDIALFYTVVTVSGDETLAKVYEKINEWKGVGEVFIVDGHGRILAGKCSCSRNEDVEARKFGDRMLPVFTTSYRHEHSRKQALEKMKELAKSLHIPDDQLLRLQKPDPALFYKWLQNCFWGDTRRTLLSRIVKNGWAPHLTSNTRLAEAYCPCRVCVDAWQRAMIESEMISPDTAPWCNV